jgi:hypothetical protein
MAGLAQDVAHRGERPIGTHRRQRLYSRVVVAGFQVSTGGRSWVSTEGCTESGATSVSNVSASFRLCCATLTYRFRLRQGSLAATDPLCAPDRMGQT